MLGKIEGWRGRGWQKMSWLGGITDSMDMDLSKLQEMVKERGAWHAAAHEVAELDMSEQLNWLTDGPSLSVLFTYQLALTFLSFLSLRVIHLEKESIIRERNYFSQNIPAPSFSAVNPCTVQPHPHTMSIHKVKSASTHIGLKSDRNRNHTLVCSFKQVVVAEWIALKKHWDSHSILQYHHVTCFRAISRDTNALWPHRSKEWFRCKWRLCEWRNWGLPV